MTKDLYAVWSLKVNNGISKLNVEHMIERKRKREREM